MKMRKTIDNEQGSIENNTSLLSDTPKWKWRIKIPTAATIWHLEAHEKGELAKILNMHIDQPGRIIITTLW